MNTAPGRAGPASGSHIAAELIAFFTDLYVYRGYLRASVARNLRVRYRNSVLGYFWSVLNPLLMMLVLVAVFSQIVRLDVKDYAVFLLSALLPWHFFNASVMQSMTSLRRAVPIFKKLPVPKQVFVADVVLSNLVVYLLSLMPLLAIMLAVGRPISWSVLLFPLHVLPLVLIASSVALLCSIGCLFFDDVNHVADVALRALYFLTPILYGAQHLPPAVLEWVGLNPLFDVIESLREIFYAGTVPAWHVLAQSLVLSTLLLLFSVWIFSRVEKRVIYVV